MKLGIDIGSIAAKVVIAGDRGEIIESWYRRTGGQPDETIRNILGEVFRSYTAADFSGAAATGTGARQLAESLGIPCVNEVVAQAAGAACHHSQVRSIIEIGGADSKLILLGDAVAGDPATVRDFTMSGACAAGTGSFLDQQAARLGIPVSRFGEIALESTHPAAIAGRCSVFAKTDMIHLQQVGTPVPDIVAGLCYAMARQFKTNQVRGRTVPGPVAFQGGVAANPGMRRALAELLDLAPDDLIVPEHHAVLGALGAVLVAATVPPPPDIMTRLAEYLARSDYDGASLPPLKGDGYVMTTASLGGRPAPGTDVFIGVDVGSISTNVVAIDLDGNVLARCYLMTSGEPIEALRRGLSRVGRELGDGVNVRGTGSTGSGRQLTGAFFGADVVRNEITSHAKGATHMCPDADTIFEIGGQDAKYISLKHGTIVDFAMNKVCAAGTGSFLEEQAGNLELDIAGEFEALALSAVRPLDLGERCTVFMESQLGFHRQHGASKPDMVSGLAYSIVKNYLTKVVESHPIGENILFQGGVAYNRAVKAAFEAVLGKPVTVPPQHDVLGAVGIALLARDEMAPSVTPSRFRGFDLADREYRLTTFVCQDCANHCEVHRAAFAGEVPLHYGSRCGKYDVSDAVGKSRGGDLPCLFEERRRHLEAGYLKTATASPDGPTVGIPRSLFYHELFPLWQAFFTALGCRVVVSGATSRGIVRRGVENVLEEPCLPIKVAFGHVLELLDQRLDYIFLPVQCTMEPLHHGFSNNWNCPITQALPYILDSSAQVTAAIRAADGAHSRLLRPVMHADRGRAHLAKTFRKLARQVGVRDASRINGAITTGFEAQDEFNAWQQQRGREVLAAVSPEHPAVVMVGRSYNTCDPEISMNLPDKLRQMGVLGLPLDFLPLEAVADSVSRDYPNMYWKSGQKILCGARVAANRPGLYGLYITNFGCGPDAFILKYFSKEMKDRPFLTLEVDEHSGDAGIRTRCEAFVDTIRGVAGSPQERIPAPPSRAGIVPVSASRRCIHLPYMLDHGNLWVAAAQYYGQDSNALPMCDRETLDLGRQHTSGKECYPGIVTLSDILKRALAPDFEPDREAFLIPSASGPCRFGQYNQLYRLTLDSIGFQEVPVITLDQTSSWGQHLANLGSGYRLRTWRASVVLDLVQKMLLARRPYEVNTGASDEVYQDLLARLTYQVGHEHDGFGGFARQARAELETVQLDRAEPRPRIGLIGEIFVRSHEFANESVVRRLEALGAECTVPPIQEWFNYTEFQRLRRSRLRIEGGWRDWLRQQISAIVQARAAGSLGRHFDGALDGFAREMPTAEVLQRGRTYLSPTVEGEAILSLGRAIEYAEHGFDGVVNVIPFGCMPGIVVSMLLHRYSQDYGIPVYNLVVDGTRDPGQDIRLEAFYHQCREHQRHAAGTPVAWR